MPRILSAQATRQLQHHLQRGGLVAYPTESCYGLGCLPRHVRALRALVRLKRRPQHKGMIVVGNDVAQLQPLLAPLSTATQNHLAAQWPARKTFLLAAHPRLPALLRGKGRSKLAVRVPDHVLARGLCAILNTALVSTSCNRAGKRPCKTAREVRRQFGAQVQLINGRIGTAKSPSQIIDLATGARLR